MTLELHFRSAPSPFTCTVHRLCIVILSWIGHETPIRPRGPFSGPQSSVEITPSRGKIAHAVENWFEWYEVVRRSHNQLDLFADVIKTRPSGRHSAAAAILTGWSDRGLGEVCPGRRRPPGKSWQHCVSYVRLTSTSQLKPGFHYSSWRPELTARVDGWPVSITAINGPSTRVVETWLNSSFHCRATSPCLTLFHRLW